MAAELSAAEDDAWKEGLRGALAAHLGIASWRVLVGFVRAASARVHVQVQVRLIDGEEESMGFEGTAEESAGYLLQLLEDNGGELVLEGNEEAVYRLTAVVFALSSPPPPPPPPPPHPPPPLSPPPLCETTGAAAASVFFDGEQGCAFLDSAVGWWRLLLVAVVIGGAVMAVLLAVLWYGVLDDEEKQSVKGAGKAKQPGKKRGACANVRQVIKHPMVSLWRSTLAGEIDLLTDVIFALSLWRAAAIARAGIVEPLPFLSTVEERLALASTVVLAVSVLFCCAGVLGLYCSLAKHDALTRRIFDMHESGFHRAAFFVVVLLAATVNIRLATLLPWTQERDRW